MEVVSGGDLSQHLEALLSLSCHPYFIIIYLLRAVGGHEIHV
jgi:hypothetical protein